MIAIDCHWCHLPRFALFIYCWYYLLLFTFDFLPPWRLRITPYDCRAFAASTITPSWCIFIFWLLLPPCHAGARLPLLRIILFRCRHDAILFLLISHDIFDCRTDYFEMPITFSLFAEMMLYFFCHLITLFVAWLIFRWLSWDAHARQIWCLFFIFRRWCFDVSSPPLYFAYADISSYTAFCTFIAQLSLRWLLFHEWSIILRCFLLRHLMLPLSPCWFAITPFTFSPDLRRFPSSDTDISLAVVTPLLIRRWFWYATMILPPLSLYAPLAFLRWLMSRHFHAVAAMIRCHARVLMPLFIATPCRAMTLLCWCWYWYDAIFFFSFADADDADYDDAA